MKLPKIFWRLRELRDSNKAGVEANEETLKFADTARDVALEQLAHAGEQARRLHGADRRNHYSESLTHAFRGETA